MISNTDRLKLHPNSFRNVSLGDLVSAREHNQIVDSFNRQYGIDQPRQLPNLLDSDELSFLQRFKIEIIAGDYLVCSPWDGFTTSEDRVNVARPFLLRTSLASHNDVTFVYTADTTRTASASGEDDETQVIVPAYVAADEIVAMRGIIGDTGAISDADGDIEWIDLNLDARAWAKQAA